MDPKWDHISCESWPFWPFHEKKGSFSIECEPGKVVSKDPGNPSSKDPTNSKPKPSNDLNTTVLIS